MHEIATREDLPSVHELLARRGLGERTVRRLFERFIGVGPKVVLRTHRFQQAMRAIQWGEHVHWSRLAADLGYADQAHFVHDFKAITGQSPSELVKFTGS
jgi:methylphosphotriester-DNA--protein-cysteine methyltransferase